MHAHLKKLDVSEFNPNNLTIFFHMPKTGGSSMADLLSAIYGDRYKRMSSKELAYLFENHSPVTDIQAVLGHYSLADKFYYHIKQPINHLTVFREPVDRVVSHYYFLRKERSHHQHNIAMKYTLKEIFETDRAIELGVSNRQVRMMSSVGFATKPRIALALAKENVSRLFTFIGLYENYNEFVQICAEKFNWPKAGIPWVNGSIRPKMDEIEPELIQTIKDHNTLDLELYDFVRNLYVSRVPELISTMPSLKKVSPKLRVIPVTRPKELTRWEKTKHWFNGWFKKD